MKRLLIILLVLFAPFAATYGQTFAVKSNLLYDLTSTINLGVEMSLSRKVTLDISGNYNPWNFGEDGKFKHIGIQPEVRYWFCEKFNGHFLGLHGHYAAYNVGGLSFLSDNMEKYRYEGKLWGGGISYGYQWILSPHWSMEAVIGAGYARLDHDKYVCANCGEWIKKDTKDYFGVTKAAISIIYIIK
ncbi:MAG: DUF3575 domain-containing protein [Porphyromonadaceae bacterium]|nr:DUF3575 domain-containing protein [Porphyromonadaceae bacterium]